MAQGGSLRNPNASRGPWEDWGLAFPWQGTLLLAITVLAAIVRISTLSFQSLWLDEVYTVVEAGRPWPDLLLALIHPQQAYPLYILGMRIWTALLGNSEFILRLPSALFGLISVPLLYRLGQRLFGWRAGMIGAGLLALSPLAVWYSQEAKAYALILLLTIAAWLLLWEAIERPARLTWWAFAGVTLLALLSHRLIAVLSIVGQISYVLYVARQGRFLRRHRRLLVGLLVAILLLAVAGLWFVMGQSGASRQFSNTRRWGNLANTLSQFSLRISPEPPGPGQGPDRRPALRAFGVVALAGLAALFIDLRSPDRRRRRAVFVLSFLLAPLGAFFLLYLIRPFYHERYLLGALPAYLLLLAVGIAALGRWTARLARDRAITFELVALTAALAYSLALPLTSWHQVREWSLTRRPSKEQFREATRHLQEHLHPGDLVVVHPGYIQPAVDHYDQRFPRVPLEVETLRAPFTEDYGFREFEIDMDKLSRGRRRAWLYIAPAHARTWDPHNWVYEWFNLNPFLHCGEGHFNGVDLYCVTFNEARREGMPTPSIPLEASFGQALLLWGADLEPFQQPLRPGDPLPLTLYVHGLQRDLPDLEVVVRLVDAEGQVAAQAASRPLGGFVPTTNWIPGDELLDYHELLLPQTIPAGRYTVQVDYRPVEDRSAALTLPDGSLWVALGTVEVVSKGASP